MEEQGLKQGDAWYDSLQVGGVAKGVGKATGEISGLNVFAQASGLFARATIGTAIATTSFSGLNVYSAGSVIEGFGRLRSNTPTGGSPATYGAWIQAGSSTTSAGSVIWVVFPGSFGRVPYVVTTPFNNSLTTELVGSFVNAGSFLAVSSGASVQFNWIAVGT